MTESHTAHDTGSPAVATLQDLVDEAAFLSHEHQLHLTDVHGADAWGAEMSTGTFTFTDASGTTTECRLQFLGTAAPGPGSWMWAWHNVNGFPDDVLRAAERVRASGLREANEPELTLTDDLPYRLALATKAVTGSYAHYSAPVGGGTRAWFLLEHPSLDLPAPSVPRVVRTLSEGLLSVTVVDQRRAVDSYAAGRGLPIVEHDDGRVVLTAGDGSVVVRFDDAGRIAGIQATDETKPDEGAAVEVASEESAPDETAPDESVEDAAEAADGNPEPAQARASARAAEPETASAEPEPRRRSWFRRRG